VIEKDCQSKTIELEANINIIAEISDPFTVAKFRQLSILYDTDEKNGPTDRILYVTCTSILALLFS